MLFQILNKKIREPYLRLFFYNKKYLYYNILLNMSNFKNKIINDYKINENKMTTKMLKKIVSESIKKTLFENMENVTMDTLEELVGYKYYPDEPHKFVDDFEMMIRDVLSTATRKNNGEELLFDTDYPECNPDMVGTYINVYRNQMNSDFMKIYNELREKQVNANNLLDECVQLFTQYKQSNR